MFFYGFDLLSIIGLIYDIHIVHNDIYRLLFRVPREFVRHVYKHILSSNNIIINEITDALT